MIIIMIDITIIHNMMSIHNILMIIVVHILIIILILIVIETLARVPPTCHISILIATEAMCCRYLNNGISGFQQILMVFYVL